MMRFSRTIKVAAAATCVAALVVAFGADGAPSRNADAVQYEYDVKWIRHGVVLDERAVDLERQLLNQMAAGAWELVEVSAYPPADTPAGLGRTGNDRLSRCFYFRRPIP